METNAPIPKKKNVFFENNLYYESECDFIYLNGFWVYRPIQSILNQSTSFRLVLVPFLGISFFFFFFYSMQIAYAINYVEIDQKKSTKVLKHLSIEIPEKKNYVLINQETKPSSFPIKIEIPLSSEKEIERLQQLLKAAEKQRQRDKRDVDGSTRIMLRALRERKEMKESLLKEPLLTELRNCLQLVETKTTKEAKSALIQCKQETELLVDTMTNMVNSVGRTYKPIQNMLWDRKLKSLPLKEQKLILEEKFRKNLTDLKGLLTIYDQELKKSPQRVNKKTEKEILEISLRIKNHLDLFQIPKRLHEELREKSFHNNQNNPYIMKSTKIPENFWSTKRKTVWFFYSLLIAFTLGRKK